MPRCELDGGGIFLIGDFNPKIFQPQWFSSHGLLTEKEVESPDELIVTSDATQFELTWLSIQVVRGQSLAQTKDPSRYLELRDLVAGTFGILRAHSSSTVGVCAHDAFRPANT